MILKEYQKTALQAVRTFLDLLVEWRQKEEAVREAVPDAGFDWVARHGIGRIRVAPTCRA